MFGRTSVSLVVGALLFSAVAVPAVAGSGGSSVGQGSPQFAVQGFDGPTSAAPGDSIAVTATVANTGDAEGTATIEYRFDGTVLASQSVTLAAGASTSVSFSGTVPDRAAGTYAHGAFVGGTNTGRTASITVERATFGVTSLAAPSRASAGDRVTATATVANTGNARGSTTVEYRIDGRSIASQSVTLDGGASTSVSLSGTVPSLSAGTYDQGVFVGGTNTGQTARITVDRPVALFRVTDLRAPSRASGGDEVSVTAVVTNIGNARGSTTVEYRIDGERIDREEVRLSPGEERRVTFSGRVPNLTRGTYEQGVFVGGSNTGQTASLRIEGRASFRISDLRAPAEASVGERVTIRATVSNVGDAEGEERIEYRIGGNDVATQRVSVRPGRSREVSFEVRVPTLAAGSYTQGVFVDNSDVGRTSRLRIRGVPEFSVSDLRAPASATVGDDVSVRATVRNTGTDRGSTRVEYRLDGRVLDSTAVTLAAGERTTVSFAAAVPDLSPGTYRNGVFIAGTDRGQTASIAIERPAPSFSVSNLEAPESAPAGGRITVRARVSNTGDGAGTTEIRYRVGERVVDSQRISLDAGERTTVRFDARLPQLSPGRYTHGVFVGETTRGATARIRVEAPQPDFNVLNLRAPPRATPGDDITVTATILNAGPGAGEATIEYRLAGETRASRGISLDPGERRTVRFEVTVPDIRAGTYSHGVFVGGTNTGQTSSIVVGSQRTPTPRVVTRTVVRTPRPTETAEGTPGFSVVVGLVALSLAALIAVRRR